MVASDALRRLRSGLIVSCQAPDDSPLNRPRLIAAMAMAVERVGASGVRINGPRNIREVRRTIDIPTIGIEKVRTRNSPVYITPDFASVCRVARAGADLVAMDCTNRRGPRDEPLGEVIRRAKLDLKAAILADVATLEDALRAVELGVDGVVTTLYGYTAETFQAQGPALRLLAQLAKTISVPVILEGRVRDPDEVRRAFDLGAYAVVVGTAITGIEPLTREFLAVTPRRRLLGNRVKSATRKSPGWNRGHNR